MEAVRWAVLALAAWAGWQCLRTADSQPLARPAWTEVRWLLRGLGCLWPAAGFAVFVSFREGRMTTWESRLAWVTAALAVGTCVVFNYHAGQIRNLERQVLRLQADPDAPSAHRRLDDVAEQWRAREAAQTVINYTLIDAAGRAARRLDDLEGRPHAADGDPAIPATNLPTVPKD